MVGVHTGSVADQQSITCYFYCFSRYIVNFMYAVKQLLCFVVVFDWCFIIIMYNFNINLPAMLWLCSL